MEGIGSSDVSEFLAVELREGMQRICAGDDVGGGRDAEANQLIAGAGKIKRRYRLKLPAFGRVKTH